MPTGTPWDPNSIAAAAATAARLGAGAAGPVLHGARSTALTYEAFYGLKEKPFSLASDSRFFYQSRSHAPAFEDLLASIRRRESLCALTGDIGTGKTTLCRAVLENLDRKTFSAFVPDPFASREDLLKVVLMDFGVLSVDDLTSGRLKGASRTELSYLLYEFLATLAPLQAFAVVIIDEAQNLSVPLLEEIRILSDSDGRERQLQVVLVGQLELRQKLKLPEMRQVDQRISVHCRLEPLGRDGVAGYIAHRLQIAGGSPDRVTFSPDAIEALYRASDGVPRLINRICDRALYQGYLRRAATIDLEIFQAATFDVDEPAAVPVTAPAVAPAVVLPVSEVRPQRPVMPPVQDFRLSEDSHDPINDWLAYAEEKAPPLAPPQRAAPPPRAANVGAPAGSIPLQFGAVDRKEGPPHLDFVPRTHMQRTMSRWGRNLGIASLWLMGVLGLAIGAGTVWTLSAELATPVVLPALPPELPIWIAPPPEVPRFPENLLLDEPDGGSLRSP